MKKRLTAGLLVIGLMASSLTPANALFGKSKCEKAISSIFEEEKIAMELWTIWNQDRYLLGKRNQISWNSISGLLDDSIPMIESDNYMYKLMNENKSCFNSKYLAEARIDYYQNIKNIKAIRNLEKDIMAKKINGAQILSKANANKFLGLYKTFLELVKDKHLDRI
jgi:hypothetical protein